jgi:hypothetical protein
LYYSVKHQVLKYRILVSQYRKVDKLEAHRVTNIMKQPRHQMSTKSPVWLMQLQYQVDTFSYSDLYTARDCFIILMLRSFQFNALTRGNQSPNSPYTKALLDVFCGIHSTPLVTRNSVTLVTATRIFASKLLTSTHRYFSSNTFLFYEVYYSETNCINTSSFNKTQS